MSFEVKETKEKHTHTHTHTHTPTPTFSWKTLKIDSGGDSEESADVSQSQKEVTEMVIPTVPNAWYAFYVKTTVVASQDVRGAISDVVYAKSSFSGEWNWGLSTFCVH